MELPPEGEGQPEQRVREDEPEQDGPREVASVAIGAASGVVGIRGHDDLLQAPERHCSVTP
jgi:hypothetical protein